MATERVFLETDEDGNLKAMPKLPPGRRVEVTFLVLPEDDARRPSRPHPDLVGKAHVHGDLIAPAIDPADWGFDE